MEQNDVVWPYFSSRQSRKFGMEIWTFYFLGSQEGYQGEPCPLVQQSAKFIISRFLTRYINPIK